MQGSAEARSEGNESTLSHRNVTNQRLKPRSTSGIIQVSPDGQDGTTVFVYMNNTHKRSSQMAQHERQGIWDGQEYDLRNPLEKSQKEMGRKGTDKPKDGWTATLRKKTIKRHQKKGQRWRENKQQKCRRATARTRSESKKRNPDKGGRGWEEGINRRWNMEGFEDKTTWHETETREQKRKEETKNKGNLIGHVLDRR